MTLGKTIAKLRNRKGWTQAQLAERVKLAVAHLNRLEHDRMKPRASTIERLAEALGVQPDDLLRAHDSSLPFELAQEEPELAQLLSQLSLLDGEQRKALTVFLRSMITCQQVQRLTTGRAS